jgi:hypothetical protein
LSRTEAECRVLFDTFETFTAGALLCLYMGNATTFAGKFFELELELELIQTQMTQKPVLRADVYARKFLWM